MRNDNDLKLSSVAGLSPTLTKESKSRLKMEPPASSMAQSDVPVPFYEVVLRRSVRVFPHHISYIIVITSLE